MVLKKLHNFLFYSAGQATASNQCHIWSKQQTKANIAKYFQGPGGTNYTQSIWRKGGGFHHHFTRISRNGGNAE